MKHKRWIKGLEKSAEIKRKKEERAAEQAKKAEDARLKKEVRGAEDAKVINPLGPFPTQQSSTLEP